MMCDLHLIIPTSHAIITTLSLYSTIQFISFFLFYIRQDIINLQKQEKMFLVKHANEALNEFKEKYMTCLSDLKKERGVLENQIVGMSLKAKNRRVTDDREKDLMKAAMYNVSCETILFFMSYQDRINYPKQRTKTGLSSVEIILSFPPWIRSYLSDILFCLGNMFMYW